MSIKTNERTGIISGVGEPTADDHATTRKYVDLPNVVNITANTFTPALGDAGATKICSVDNTGGNIFTIPTNASVAYPIDSVINIDRISGITVVTPASGVTLNGSTTSDTHILASYDSVKLRKIDTDSWIITGDKASFLPFTGAFVWGTGGSGRLGLDNTTTYSTIQQLGSLTDWASFSAGWDHSHAVKDDGTLWGWGKGSNGTVGHGYNYSVYSPKQIGGLTTWSADKHSAGYRKTVAIQTDGTMWAWGKGSFGGNGDGTTIDRNSPVQIAGTTWSKCNVGNRHEMAIRTDNTLWMWGRGLRGALGVGDENNRSSPTQVTGTTWSEVAGGQIHTLAIKTDGTMWSWGDNSKGELGLGDTVRRSSPVQIGGLTTWDKVSAYEYRSFAIKTDGTLWSWGKDGSLGFDSGGTHYSSPVQIGTDTDWTNMYNSSSEGFAKKSDGSTWGWGFGSRLGLGNEINYKTPVRVVLGRTNWTKFGVGASHVVSSRG